MVILMTMMIVMVRRMGEPRRPTRLYIPSHDGDDFHCDDGDGDYSEEKGVKKIKQTAHIPFSMSYKNSLTLSEKSFFYLC